MDFSLDDGGDSYSYSPPDSGNESGGGFLDWSDSAYQDSNPAGGGALGYPFGTPAGGDNSGSAPNTNFGQVDHTSRPANVGGSGFFQGFTSNLTGLFGNAAAGLKNALVQGNGGLFQNPTYSGNTNPSLYAGQPGLLQSSRPLGVKGTVKKPKSKPAANSVGGMSMQTILLIGGLGLAAIFLLKR